MPVPESFQTARLEGERIAPAHLPDLRVLHRDPKVMAELGGVRSDAETARYLARNLSHWDTHGFGVWMLRPMSSQSWIGRVVLRWLSTGAIEDVEIGFAFVPEFRRQGYAFEAATAILEHGRTRLGIARIVAILAPDNVASAKLLCKLGFEFENSFQKEPNLDKLDLYVFNG